MKLERANWLAIFAVAIGTWSVVVHSDLAFTFEWLIASAAAFGTALAWTWHPALGQWFAGAAGVLWLVGALSMGPRSDETMAVTSGACAGMLVGLAASWLWRRLRSAPT